MKYSTEEKMRAVKVYKENGSIIKTVRQTGYPRCRRMLYDWVAEYDRSGTVMDKRCGRTEIASYSQEQTDKAVFFYHSYRKGIQAAVAAAVEFSSVERSQDDLSGEHGLSKRQGKEAAAVLSIQKQLLLPAKRAEQAR